MIINIGMTMGTGYAKYVYTHPRPHT